MDNQLQHFPSIVCDKPIFIIGSPRSGTSILAWALAQHSNLWTSGETFLLYDLFGNGLLEKAFNKTVNMPLNWFSLQNTTRQEFSHYLGFGLNALFSSRSKGQRWIDQTPGYTIMVETIAEMFPTAQFLHILRDGRRVVHSMLNFINSMDESKKQALVKSTDNVGWYDFESACKAWSNFVEKAMLFCKKNPERCLTVVNENLVKNTENEFSTILNFLNEKPESEPSDFFRKNKINSSFTPPSDGSNWVQRLSEPWKEWDEGQQTMFSSIAENTMRHYRKLILPQ